MVPGGRHVEDNSADGGRLTRGLSGSSCSRPCRDAGA